jgi:hypothetical protein
VIVDGYPGTVQDPTAVIESDRLTARIKFSSLPVGGEIQLAIKHTGKGCGGEAYDNFIAVMPSSEGNVFMSEVQGTSCNLVVTDVGTRLVGSFQGDVGLGVVGDAGPNGKHVLALVFDIPITR